MHTNPRRALSRVRVSAMAETVIQAAASGTPGVAAEIAYEVGVTFFRRGFRRSCPGRLAVVPSWRRRFLDGYNAAASEHH